MGEVIEIGIVSQTKNTYSNMLNFLESYLNMKNTVWVINIMDNWLYDNMIEINSIKEAEYYMESKIVTIERRSPYNQVGVSVEKSKKGYIIECWINPYNEMLEKEYRHLIDEIINYLKDKNMVDVCGIGKEVSVDYVDYSKNIYTLINDSHNIDVWLFSQRYYTINKLNHLNIKMAII